MYDAASIVVSSMMIRPNGHMHSTKLNMPIERTDTYGTPFFLSHFTMTGGARLSSASEKKPLEPDAIYVLNIEHCAIIAISIKNVPNPAPQNVATTSP